MEEKSNDFGTLKNKPRSKKLQPKIDLSAMVSVSFLLIIFFMVAKELAKPQVMEFGQSDSGCRGPEPGCRLMDHRRQVTLLLDDHNKIISYRGIIEAPDEAPKLLGYGKESIRKELLHYTTAVGKEPFHERGVIVLIKPSKHCTYGNLVDILDEMNILNIGTYAVVNDFSPEEHDLLAAN